MTVLLFPPRAFFSSLVSTESLNGTLTFFPDDLSARAAIQLPRLLRDWLIAAPSFSLSPVAPVLEALSLKQKRNKLTFFLQQLEDLHRQRSSLALVSILLCYVDIRTAL